MCQIGPGPRSNMRKISLSTHLNPLSDCCKRLVCGHGSHFATGTAFPFRLLRPRATAPRLPIVPIIAKQRHFVPNVGKYRESPVTDGNLYGGGLPVRNRATSYSGVPYGDPVSREGIVYP